MSKTIKFYKPTIKYENTFTNIDFNEILMTIFGNERLNSIRKIKDFDTIIQIHDNENFDESIQSILFLKYRSEHMPYTGNIIEETLEELSDKSIVEITNIVYDQRHNILLFEYCGEGHKEKQLEEYIDEFLPENYSLRLRSILDDYSIEEILRTGRARSIDFKLNLEIPTNDKELLREGYQEDEGCIRSFFNMMKGMKAVTGDIEAKQLEFSMSLGRKKGSFNLEEFRNVIEPLNIDNPIFESIKVKVELNSENQIKEIDLKKLFKPHKITILKSKIDINASYERIQNEMIEKYIDSHRNKLMTYTRDILVEADFNFENMIMVLENN